MSSRTLSGVAISIRLNRVLLTSSIISYNKVNYYQIGGREKLNIAISEQINALVKHINSATPVTSIIVFGSQVNGVPTKDSDIDICVITHEQEKRKLQILREIRKAISPIISSPVDILVYHENEFAERASLPTTLEFKIEHEGIKVYGQ